MALGKSIDTDIGLPATYWNIGEMVLNFRAQEAKVILYGYANDTARRSGKKPITAVPALLQGDKFTPDLSRATAYEVLKQLPEFNEASDI